MSNARTKTLHDSALDYTLLQDESSLPAPSAPALQIFPAADAPLAIEDESLAPPSYAQVMQEWYDNQLSQAQQVEMQRQYILFCQNQQAVAALQAKLEMDQQARDRMDQHCSMMSDALYETSLINLTPWDYYNIYYMSRFAADLIRFNIHIEAEIIHSALNLSTQLASGIFHAAQHLAPHLAAAGNSIGHAVVDAGSTVINVAHHVGSGLVSIGGSASHALGGSGGNASDESNNLEKGVLGIVVLAAIAAGIAIAVGGAVYAAKKAYESARNLFKGKKIGKSILRLGATGGGAYLGATYGVIIGGIVGSAIPVIGTTIGAILGGVIGGGTTAGLMSVAAKYVGKALTFLGCQLGLYGHEEIISKTNPSKYLLTKTQKVKMQANGVDTNRIHVMMKAAHKQKNKLSIFDDKKPFNQLLEDGIKSNPTVALDGYYKVAPGQFFVFENNSRWEMRSDYQPPQRQALTLGM
jgi:hypothetical protein